jgi:hypothetical protein
MINWLGVSGAVWSLVIQILGFVGAFCFGLTGNKRHLTLVAVVIGLGCNFVGQIGFAGGGPGAAVGLLLLPIYCIICGHLGRGVWWLARGRKQGRQQ